MVNRNTRNSNIKVNIFIKAESSQIKYQLNELNTIGCNSFKNGCAQNKPCQTYSKDGGCGSDT